MKYLTLLLVLAGLPAAAQPPLRMPALKLPDGFLLVAHRGGVVEEGLPENSLAALEAAITRGYTHAEVDVNCTKDGVPICLHDQALRRVAGDRRLIADVTLAELREVVSVDLVPDFETVCARAEGRIGLMLDIKDFPKAVHDTACKSMLDSLGRHGLLDGMLVIGKRILDPAALAQARVNWSGELDNLAGTPDSTRKKAAYFYFRHPKDLTPEAVAKAREQGLPVIASVNLLHYKKYEAGVRGRKDIQRMLELGVDGLQIDSAYEPALRRYLANARKARANRQ